MWLKIKNTFTYYKICFNNWRLGNGFRLPEPSEKMKCFVDYCQQIVDGTLKHSISTYETKIIELMETNENTSREEVAKGYILAYKDIFEEGKPW